MNHMRIIYNSQKVLHLKKMPNLNIFVGFFQFCRRCIVFNFINIIKEISKQPLVKINDVYALF